MPVELTTTNNSFRYPTSGNNGSNFAQGVADLATDADGMWLSGTFAARPAASKVNRRYYATDTGQWFLDTGGAWITLLGSVTVTSLPPSPFDGQRIDLQVDATNGVVWSFRYRAASASTYKWEFVGGPPLYAEVLANEFTTSASYTDLATVGPSLTLPTLPTGGDFDITVGALMNPTGVASVGSTCAMAYAIGGTAAGDNDAAQAAGSPSGTTIYASTMRTRRKTGLVSANTVTAKYRGDSGAHTAIFVNRFLQILPVRVG